MFDPTYSNPLILWLKTIEYKGGDIGPDLEYKIRIKKKKWTKTYNMPVGTLQEVNNLIYSFPRKEFNGGSTTKNRKNWFTEKLIFTQEDKEDTDTEMYLKVEIEIIEHDPMSDTKNTPVIKEFEIDLLGEREQGEKTLSVKVETNDGEYYENGKLIAKEDHEAEFIFTFGVVFRRTLWLSAGHGGSDPGAQYSFLFNYRHLGPKINGKYHETEIALAQRKMIKRKLRPIWYTYSLRIDRGNPDTFKWVAKVVGKAVPVDIILDLHFNSSRQIPFVNSGCLCLIYSKSHSGIKRKARRISNKLNSIISSTHPRIPNKGIQEKSKAIFGTPGTGIILETCFGNNLKDYSAAARAINRRIANYLNQELSK